MQSQQDDETRCIALYNSDTDDWTLISQPGSAGSKSPDASPERLSPIAVENPAAPQTPSSNVTSTETIEQTTNSSQIRDLTDDPGQSCSRDETTSIPRRRASPLFVCAKKLALASESTSFQQMVLNGAIRSERANDADDESDGMTEVNLDENGTASIREHLVATTKPDKGSSDEWTDEVEEQDSDEADQDGDNFKSRLRVIKSNLQAMFVTTDRANEEMRRQNEILSNIEAKLKKSRLAHRTVDEPSSQRPSSSSDQQNRSEFNRNLGSWFEPLFLCSLLVCSLFIIISCILAPKNSSYNYNSQKQRTSERLFNNTFDFLYSDPSNHAYTELKLLNDEIADCIEKENPVMRELAHWRSMNSKELSKYKTITNARPFKGLVCYENEVKWRKRFNFLKTEFNFDLRKIIRQIKRRLTNDILVSYHPHTPFELVLNQLEYLDHVEQRRKDRALEKLKAENLDLIRRLNSRSASEEERRYNKSQYNKQQQQQQHSQKDGKLDEQSTIKSLIILESENVHLRREVESLKSRLAEKTGTIYIKQSIELEKCERENNALKQFHQDVVEEVGNNLIKIGVQQAGAFTHATTSSKDDNDSLSARLASTRNSIAKLSEQITRLVDNNKNLEKDAAELTMLNAMVTREAQNLITEAYRLKRSCNDRQHAPSTILSRGDPPQSSGFVRMSPRDRIRLERDAGTETNSKLSEAYLSESNEDWLSKRAHHREQLRDLSVEQKARLIHPIDSSEKGDTEREQHLKRINERKRLDSVKKLNKKNFVAPRANSYNDNSSRNCKNQHRREEL